MLEYTELKPGKFVVLDGQPYQVMDYHFVKMQMRKPVVQSKLKNLISGKVMERTFQPANMTEEAEIIYKPIKYLYNSRGEFWFCEAGDPSKRFKLDEALIANYIDLVKVNSLIDGMVFDEKIIGIRMPVKVDLEVTEAPPNIRGNTAQGGNKPVTVETGATINAPLFVETGDIIRINTETREYVERVQR